MAEPTVDNGRKPDGTFAAGNPGRPKGSRNKLGEQFLSDLQALWETDGADVLREARTEKPMEFAKMIAGILPKELLVRKAPEDEMTDDELADAIENLSNLASQLRADREGTRQTHEGTGKAH